MKEAQPLEVHAERSLLLCSMVAIMLAASIILSCALAFAKSDGQGSPVWSRAAAFVEAPRVSVGWESPLHEADAQGPYSVRVFF